MPRQFWPSLLAAVFLVCGASRAATANHSFADEVASQLVKALPGYHVMVVDPLTIKIGKTGQPEDQRFQINLDRIASYCARAPDDCADAVSEYVSNTVPTIKAQEPKPATAALRAVVRPAAYVADLANMEAKYGNQLVSAPFAGDLVMLCYFDEPTAMRPALTGDLAKIGLSPARALAICVQNTRTALPRLPTAPSRQGPLGAIGDMEGDPYESSYLLLHDEWAPLAAKFGGHVLVAAPDADEVFFTGDADPAAVDVLSTLAKKAYGEAQRPISATVFRWTSGGWEVAAP